MSITIGDSDIVVSVENAKVEDSTWLVVEQDGGTVAE